MDRVIKDATREDKEELLSVVRNKADVVMVRGRKFNVRWMHPATDDWISDLFTRKGNDGKILCQAAALIALNGFWKCHLAYWIVWRWYYYVRQYTSEELMPLFEMAQKKTAQEELPAYLRAMTLLTVLNTTNKQKTKEEAERFLQELRTDRDGKSPKNTE